MTSIKDVSQAALDRIAPCVQGWSPIWFEPRGISPPMYAVFARDPWGELKIAQGHSTAACWHMQIGLYLAAPTPEAEKSAHLKMSELVDTEGPIMTRLRDKTIDDDLSRLVGGSLTLGMGRGMKIVHRNGARILPAYIDFDCRSKR